MKSYSVYLIVMVLSVSSQSNTAEGFFINNLFDYLIDTIEEYYDYDSAEDSNNSTTITINESALHDLIMKLCNVSTTKPPTTTKSPTTSTSSPATTVQSPTAAPDETPANTTPNADIPNEDDDDGETTTQ